MDALTSEEISKFFCKIPLKDRPQKLYYDGKRALLERPKIAIVGARRAGKYAKTQTLLLASKLSLSGFCVVSGAAEGIDAAAHEGSYPSTVAVMPCGLDIVYPKANKNLIQKIKENSLIISEYEPNEEPRNYSFVRRNRLAVGMSAALVIAEADENSGSMRSAEYALKYDVPIFVLPHRIDESKGTNALLKNGAAKALYDFDDFLNLLGATAPAYKEDDEALIFASGAPSAAEFFALFGERLYELELEGKIHIKNGVVIKLT